uniref:Photosystem II reaction center Psb28 protein n=1 Tax=Dictyopteris divaricata TaxID=156996 RepID=A0A2I4Q2L4_9PHAE|nr:Photosystem II reaction center protein W (psb28) [Dictyopteris divaricata]YP_010205372.1 Photosystem II reaction center protein W (psb28) [Grateloupia livida]AQZ25083.1 Photosystem II reaction center protein W (psb28) [Dictyopteris divaricata]UAV85941.1 Photosystem II reaction center protein W (psb28) [Grateloupia livida]
MKPIIQFIKGIDEVTIPIVNITRSRDGSTGTATFIFEDPNIFYNILGTENEITGMFLIDDEGTLSTRDITAKFIQGKPKTIQATYIIKNSESWDRFMRFMERYATENKLTFIRS